MTFGTWQVGGGGPPPRQWTGEGERGAHFQRKAVAPSLERTMVVSHNPKKLPCGLRKKCGKSKKKKCRKNAENRRNCGFGNMYNSLSTYVFFNIFFTILSFCHFVLAGRIASSGNCIKYPQTHQGGQLPALSSWGHCRAQPGPPVWFGWTVPPPVKEWGQPSAKQWHGLKICVTNYFSFFWQGACWHALL